MIWLYNLLYKLCLYKPKEGCIAEVTTYWFYTKTNWSKSISTSDYSVEILHLTTYTAILKNIKGNLKFVSIDGEHIEMTIPTKVKFITTSYKDSINKYPEILL